MRTEQLQALGMHRAARVADEKMVQAQMKLIYILGLISVPVGIAMIIIGTN